MATENDKIIEVRSASVGRRTFASEFAARNRPVVLRGGNFWRHTEPLSPALLRRWYGDRPLHAMRAGMGGAHGIRESHAEAMPTFADYLARLEREEAGVQSGGEVSPSGRAGKEKAGLPYVTNLDLAAFEEVSANFWPLDCFGRNWLRALPRLRQIARGELFIGPGGTTYGELHFDRLGLFVATYQLHGSKKWWLYPPKQSRLLYPRAYTNDWYPHYSPVDQEQPDLKAYPLFEQARGVELTLEAGDVLFCPSWWWHNTRNLTTSVSIALRMVSEHNAGAFARHTVAHLAISAAISLYRSTILNRD